MSHELPPGLDDFGERLREAADARIADERRQHGRKRTSNRRRVIITLTAIALTSAAAATAGRSIFERDGDPIPPERQTPAALAPGSPGGIVTSSATPDPAGGSPWAVKVFTNPAAAECVIAGRLRNGVLGQIEGRRFRALPENAPGVCGNVAEDGLVAAFARRTQPAPRTVVYGISSGRNPVTVHIDGRRHVIDPKGLGTFLLVLEGIRAEANAAVSTTVDGRPVTIRLR